MRRSEHKKWNRLPSRLDLFWRSEEDEKAWPRPLRRMTAECRRQFVETGRRFAHAERRNHATNGSLGSALGDYCARAGPAARFLRLEHDSPDVLACARACLANGHCNPRHGIPMISPGFHPPSSRFQTQHAGKFFALRSNNQELPRQVTRLWAC